PRRSAELFADACASWGREHFGDGVDYDELVALATRVVAAGRPAGLPLFAAWREMPVPADGRGAAMHQLNVLRELRGGAHLLAVGATLGYTPALGIDPLRRRIAELYDERYGVVVDPARVVATAGASGAVVLALLASFDAGARVAVAEPGYPCYRQIMTAL